MILKIVFVKDVVILTRIFRENHCYISTVYLYRTINNNLYENEEKQMNSKIKSYSEKPYLNM